jgi:aryl-phospho-beta-D-glucosidase BglC (GH1 family)
MGKKKNYKRIKKLIFLSGVVLSLSVSFSSFRALASSRGMEAGQEDGMKRFLKADGKVLKNGKGEVVTLRGTNIGGWQLMEGWMCPTNAVDQKTTIETFTERFGKEKAEELIKVYEKHWWQEDDFNNIAELNFNVLRLPISYLNLLDEEGLLREDTLSTYDLFVDECEKRGIYVILDLHAAPGSQNGRDHSGDTSGSKLYKEEKYQDVTVSLWEQLAEHYKGNPNIAGYDLLNEPEGDEVERAPWGATQIPFYDRLYKAIRAIDPDHLIILGAIWEPSNMPDPSEYGWENVMYEYHYYGWDGTDDSEKQRSFTNAKVQNDDRMNFDVPVLVGEFTLFDKLQSWEYALNTYEEHGWSWTTWTYKTVEYGNWGIYTSKKSDTPDVDIHNDSAEVIEEKWSKIDTKTSFSQNKYLFDLLRVMADKDEGNKNLRKWYQNLEGDITLRAGREAEAELVSGSEVTGAMGDDKILRLTLTGNDYDATEISRNVCISPSIRNSVDATGMDYLIINTFVRQGKKPLYVTLVDKEGNTWSSFTSTAATPVPHRWEKLFLDISNAKIDKSAIIEIRVGTNLTGTYYFNDIYFAQSYGDKIPTETVEEMKLDMGESGVILDWVEEVDGNKIELKPRMLGIILGAVAFITGILSVVFIMLKKRKK